MLVTAALAALCLPALVPDPEDLVGTWRVDLRVFPDSVPYYKQLDIRTALGIRLTGTFYDSELEQTIVTPHWNGLSFSFVTHDASTEYRSTGVLRDGRISGMTHAIERDSLVPWRAIKLYDDPKLTSEQAMEDVVLFRHALETIHPGIYRYTSKPKLDAEFDLLGIAYANGVQQTVFYRDIALLVAAIGCGHTRAEAPESLTTYRQSTPTHLPFTFRIIDNRMIIDDVREDITELRRGDEITSINGIAVEFLIKMIAPTMQVDGNVDSIRTTRLDTAYEYADTGLEHFLPLSVGWRDDFQLEVVDENNISRKELVNAITLTQWEQTFAGEPANFADSISLELFNETAVLTIDSFINYRNTVNAAETLKPYFQSITVAGITHLVIDLRNNGGGSGDAVWALASYLIEEPLTFRAPLVKNYRFDDALKANMTTWDPAAMSMPDNAFIKLDNGMYELKPEVTGGVQTLSPHQNRYRGPLTILTGPYNASGTTMLVATLDEQLGDRLKLIGEPTAGNAQGPTAGTLFFLTLPNSGIRVNIPALLERTPLNKPITSVGVVPDIMIKPTIDDFRAGRDPVLERAVREW
ncbi:MAG: hypothetical protein H6815_05200 [Phycisphaeraceae bacterium]|nr:hypothetical protein [Phycisphaerales bacterium]MCB9859833.1 hypothetical protein [Phycisphaeraceae bacterium]